MGTKERIIARLSGASTKDRIISALGGTPDGDFQPSEYQALDDIVGFGWHENMPPEYPLELIEPNETSFGLYLREKGGEWVFYLSKQLPQKRRDAFARAAKQYQESEAAIRAEAMANGLPVQRNQDGHYLVNNPQEGKQESVELREIPGWQEGKDGIMEKYQSYFK